MTAMATSAMPRPRQPGDARPQPAGSGRSAAPPAGSAARPGRTALRWPATTGAAAAAAGRSRRSTTGGAPPATSCLSRSWPRPALAGARRAAPGSMTAAAAVTVTSTTARAGSSRRARRTQKPRRSSCPRRSHWATSRSVIRYPLSTKKTSTRGIRQETPRIARGRPAPRARRVPGRHPALARAPWGVRACSRPWGCPCCRACARGWGRPCCRAVLAAGVVRAAVACARGWLAGPSARARSPSCARRPCWVVPVRSALALLFPPGSQQCTVLRRFGARRNAGLVMRGGYFLDTRRGNQSRLGVIDFSATTRS